MKKTIIKILPLLVLTSAIAIITPPKEVRVENRRQKYDEKVEQSKKLFEERFITDEEVIALTRKCEDAGLSARLSKDFWSWSNHYGKEDYYPTAVHCEPRENTTTINSGKKSSSSQINVIIPE